MAAFETIERDVETGLAERVAKLLRDDEWQQRIGHTVTLEDGGALARAHERLGGGIL